MAKMILVAMVIPIMTIPLIVEAFLQEAQGVIKAIRVENFMCHKNLYLALNSRVNFITGRNGSGKSAVIAALQLCLGATASETQRGKAIKDLICRDCDGHAYLSVTLQNPKDLVRTGMTYTETQLPSSARLQTQDLLHINYLAMLK